MVIDVSVVVPMYNEENTLKSGVLDKINDYLSSQTYTWEVLLLNDASSDKTLALANKYAQKHTGFKVIDHPHRGKAGNVIIGMLKARGNKVAFCDADLSTPISELGKLLDKLNGNCQIAIGSRSGRKGAPLVRQLMSVGFVVLRTLVLRLPYKDTQCGFKAFTKAASDMIFSKMEQIREQEVVKGYSVTAGFDLELLYLARKFGFKVSEVPVDWHEEREKGKVNPIKDSWVGLKGMLNIRYNAIIGKYK